MPCFSSSRQAPVLVDHVFDAIGLLVRSMGPAIRHAVHDQLELIFTCELSESLVRMLEIIVRYISTLLGVIQGQNILFHPPNSPSHRLSQHVFSTVFPRFFAASAFKCKVHRAYMVWSMEFPPPPPL